MSEQNKPLISVVIPAFNEAGNITSTMSALELIFKNVFFKYEVIFVDDGSRDTTWAEICKMSNEYPNLKAISFSRNFGKEAAIYAGLKYCNGAAAVVMDCDLQHPPETIIKMAELWQQGYEVVEGIKTNRGTESKFHTLAANMFYGIISKATGIDMANASDFKLLDRKVINELLAMPERNSFFRALSSWVGFNVNSVGFQVQDRKNGISKWSLNALMSYAITNIVSFTSIPLQLVTFSGVIFLLIAFGLGLQTLYRYFSGNAIEGFTTVILLLLIIGSFIMISLGIIGYYISKMYDEIKHRPKYIISKTI